MEKFIVIAFYPLARAVDETRSELFAVIARVLDSGVVIGGNEVNEFETEFAKLCGSRHCVSVGNGLDALRLSLAALGIGPGDEVIVPGHTFAATFMAVRSCGALPIAIDVEMSNANLDPRGLEDALSHRTKAILPVHLHGWEADIQKISEFATENNLAVVADAAQAHGAPVFGKFTRPTDLVAFSFYPTKNLPAFGDAGCVVTDSAELAQSIRQLANYGTTISKYDHSIVGFNSRLDSLQAAILRLNLQHLATWNSRRRFFARRYLQGLQNPLVKPLHNFEDVEAGVWHHFIVLCKERGRLREHLAMRGVQTEVHYPIAAYAQKAFAGLPGLGPENTGRLPISDYFAASTLSIPMHPWLTTDEVDEVIEGVNSFDR